MYFNNYHVLVYTDTQRDAVVERFITEQNVAGSNPGSKNPGDPRYEKWNINKKFWQLEFSVNPAVNG